MSRDSLHRLIDELPENELELARQLLEQVKEGDMVIQPCEKKHLTNMRASGSDMAIKLTPPRELNIEQAIEWINDDELVEVVPAAIRVRKRTLDHSLRKVKAKAAG